VLERWQYLRKRSVQPRRCWFGRKKRTPEDASHDAAESSNEAKGVSIESLRRSLWARGRRVFISSTSMDLEEWRAVVAQVVRDAGLEVLTMEQFPAMAADASGGSLTMIRRCRLFVGVYARRYGTTDAQGRSITELEYEEATARNLPRICFLLVAHADLPAQLVEPEPGASKLETLKQRIRQDVIVKEFASLSELEAQARAALDEYLGKERKRSRRRVHAVLAGLLVIASLLLAWRGWSHTDHYQVRAVLVSIAGDPAFRTLGMDTDPGRWLAEAARAGRVREAVRAADALGDTGARVLALARLVPEVARANGAEAATVLAGCAAKLVSELEYPGNRWRVLLALADAHKEIGLRAAAGPVLGDAENVARSLEYAEGRAPALTQIGLAHLRFGNRRAAREAALLAMKESLAIQDDAGRARALTEVLPLLSAVADAKTTAEAAEEAVRVAASQADPMQRGVVLAQVAKGLVAAARLDLAAEAVDASIAAIQRLPEEKLRNFARFTALTSLLEGGPPADGASALLAQRLADRVSSAGLRARGQARIAALSADSQVREANTARAFDALASLRDDPSQQLTVAAQMAEIFTLAGRQDAASKAADVALQLILRDPLNASTLDVFGQTALALTQADRRAEAEEVVDVGLDQAYQWDGAKERSKLLSTMARVMAKWGDLRGARLVALECTEPLDRFEAFAAILTAYADSADMQ
jgi:Domain of unknown function (DUF4062)